MLLYFVLREGLRFEIKKASFPLKLNTLDPLHKIEKELLSIFLSQLNSWELWTNEKICSNAQRT